MSRRETHAQCVRGDSPANMQSIAVSTATINNRGGNKQTNKTPDRQSMKGASSQRKLLEYLDSNTSAKLHEQWHTTMRELIQSHVLGCLGQMDKQWHTTNSALHRKTRKTCIARLQFYTTCDNIYKENFHY